MSIQTKKMLMAVICAVVIIALYFTFTPTRLGTTKFRPDGSTVRPDGSVLYMDGTIRNPDGTIIFRNGNIIRPDGSVFLAYINSVENVNPDGSKRITSGYTPPGKASTVRADGTVLYPNGTIRYPDGNILLSNGNIIKPDGNFIYPNTGTVILAKPL